MYNKHGKSSTESKKYRTSGETYELALRMLKEKKDKAAGSKLSPFLYGQTEPAFRLITRGAKVPTPRTATCASAILL
jgi:hypothetical protein